MSAPNRSDVAPATVRVRLREEGVEVEYLDGRVTFYHGVPERVEGSLTTPPGKETHVLVTDPSETEGVLVYVNDLKTHDDVLEDTGVGRVLLDEGEEEELFPGVTARRLAPHRTELEADPGVAGGRVFAFVEDDWSERSYEFVGADAASDGDEGDAGSDAGESDRAGGGTDDGRDDAGNGGAGVEGDGEPE